MSTIKETMRNAIMIGSFITAAGAAIDAGRTMHMSPEVQHKAAITTALQQEFHVHQECAEKIGCFDVLDFDQHPDNPDAIVTAFERKLSEELKAVPKDRKSRAHETVDGVLFVAGLATAGAAKRKGTR